MSFIERCIRLPVTVSVVVLLIVIFGLLALRSVPVQLTPNVDQPIITVTTNWFGASPQEIVREIIEEQEDVLKSVSGLKEMTAQATEGEGNIRLEFAVGVDKDAALNEVRDKLRQVPEYPRDADQPVVEETDRFNRDYIAWILVRPKPGFEAQGPPAAGFDGDIAKLGTFLDEFVKPVLERAEGVSEINVLGAREQEVQVRVDLEKLASRGITVSQMADAMRGENLDVTAGTVEQGKRNTSIRVLGQYGSPEQVASTVIAYTDDGAEVYVRDVATIVESFKKETGFVRSLGDTVVAINAQRETGSNVLTVMNNLKASIDEVNTNILGPRNWGIELHQVYDQTIYIDQSVNTAVSNLVIGALLAGAVLFFTLRSVGATLVVMVAIPISIVGTFLGMALTGRSLNVISMAGLTFAVGMGIDNAIVVLENIFRHREMGKDRIKAAVDGTREVGGAIVASTLTNVAVFLPVIFIEAEAGQLFADMSVALTISFVIYLFVAPTVIPMLTTLFLRRMPAGLRNEAAAGKQTRLGRMTAPIGRIQKRLADRFYHVILWLTGGLLRRAAFVLVMLVGSFFAVMALMPPTDYLPPGNQNLIFGILAPPPGYNVDEFRRMGSEVEDYLRPWWEAADDPEKLAELQREWRAQIEAVVIPQMETELASRREQLEAQGLDAEQIRFATAQQTATLEGLRNTELPPAIDNFFFVNRGSIAFMGARSTDEDNVSPLQYLMNGSVQDIPGTFGFFRQAPIFRIARNGTGLELAIFGENGDAVREAASAIQTGVFNPQDPSKSLPGLLQAFNTYPQSDPQNFNLGRPQVNVLPDNVRAASAGVGGAPAIRDTVQVAVDGLILGDYRDRVSGRSVDLTIVSNTPRDARFVEQLADIPLATRNETVVPLSAVASIVQTDAPQQVNRTQEQTSVTLTLDLPATMTIQEAQEIAESQVLGPLREAGHIPPDVKVNLQGAASKLGEFLDSFKWGLLLAFVITYLLLASLFEHFLHPLTIILSVPFAMVGGFAGLAILHAFVPETKLDVLTMLGFVILIGTIVNNPILIVYQALNFYREGMPQNEAIARSAQTRVRPIFMSVITTTAGLSPLVIVGGAGSELYRGLGAVLLGGLILSTFVTLFLTPTLMSLLLDAQTLVGRMLGKLKGGKEDDEESGKSRPPRQVLPVDGQDTDGNGQPHAAPVAT
ncbi:MAG: efflux RND transporter permease subunit [Phycisphaerae bacterium]